jgi:hypothetical protein
MEILKSVIIGVALREVYAWLDPLAMWLLRRAAQELPEDRQEEFLSQFEADLATVPNSVVKVFLVLRDCVLPIRDIQQTMVRDKFARVADKSEELVERANTRADLLLRKSGALAERSERTSSRMMSTLDASLKAFQGLKYNDETEKAVARCQALKGPLTQELHMYHARVAQHHDLFAQLAANMSGPLARVADAERLIRLRLLDERPIDDDDFELLQSVDASLDELGLTLDSFDEHQLDVEPSIDLMIPSIKTTVEAFRATADLLGKGKLSLAPMPSAAAD